MYCSKCGEKFNSGAKFCTNCGQHLSSPNQATISIAVHLKTGMFKREPWVLWIGPQKSALICIGQEHYESIVAGSAQTVGDMPKERGMEQAFRSYAEGLTVASLDHVLQSHPKSVSFDTAQILKLQIVATYDSDMSRFDDYERFLLDTPKGKYRGVIERDTALQNVIPILKEILGSRYIYRTIEGFPFI